MEEELKQYALQLKLQNPGITQEDLTNKVIQFKNTLNVDPESNLSVSQALENRDTAKRKAIFKGLGCCSWKFCFWYFARLGTRKNVQCNYWYYGNWRRYSRFF